MYIYICTYTYIRTHTYIYIYINIHQYTHTYMYAHMCNEDAADDSGRHKSKTKWMQNIRHFTKKKEQCIEASIHE